MAAMNIDALSKAALDAMERTRIEWFSRDERLPIVASRSSWNARASVLHAIPVTGSLIVCR
jgi:hypothetical protein